MDEKILFFILGVVTVFFPVMSSAGETDADLPDIELLEFLADFETDDGRWVDPEELEGMMIVNIKGNKSESEAVNDE